MLPVIPVQASRATQELPPLVIPAQAGTQLSPFKSQIRVRGHKGREKRLACAAMGDFCVALYNPSSKGRPDYLARAVCILLENGKSADTVCGIVRNIGRKGQTARILTLAQLENTAVDMFTTVYIGNAATKQLGGKMVTPRGYRR